MTTKNHLKEAIILAGGKGTRLLGINDGVPKPMMRVCGEPFLAFLLHMLHKAGIRKVILSIGYKHEIISSYFGAEFNGMAISYCVEESPLGTGGAVTEAIRLTEEDNVAVLNGDSYFDIDIAGFFSHHVKNDADITIAVKYQQECVRFGSVSIADGRIVSFREKGVSEGGYINGGFYLMNRRMSGFLQSGQAFSFESDLLEKETRSLSIIPFISDGYFIDIGTPDDYRRAQLEFAGMMGAIR